MLQAQANVYSDKEFRDAFEPLAATTTDPFARKVVVEKATPDIDKLNCLVKQSKKVLFRASTVFPFDFFPNLIQIDENKIDIMERLFFFSEQIFPIAISDIKNVTVTTDLFFASLTIEIGGYEQNPGTIKFLWKSDALRIRRLLFGLMEAKKEKIDLSCIDRKELIPKLEMIGAARKEYV